MAQLSDLRNGGIYCGDGLSNRRDETCHRQAMPGYLNGLATFDVIKQLSKTRLRLKCANPPHRLRLSISLRLAQHRRYGAKKQLARPSTVRTTVIPPDALRALRLPIRRILRSPRGCLPGRDPFSLIVPDGFPPLRAALASLSRPRPIRDAWRTPPPGRGRAPQSC